MTAPCPGGPDPDGSPDNPLPDSMLLDSMPGSPLPDSTERVLDAVRVEFRCPEPGYSALGVRHPGPLFAVMWLDEAQVLATQHGHIEIACQRCKQRLSRAGRPVRRVVHRYTFTGDLAETLTEGSPAV